MQLSCVATWRNEIWAYTAQKLDNTVVQPETTKLTVEK